jgi:hypothetical protein
MSTAARKYDWLCDNIQHLNSNLFGEGCFFIDLSGIEVESEVDETIFDWLVEQAMKNEEQK